MTNKTFKNKFSKQYRRAVIKRGVVISKKPMTDTDLTKLYNVFTAGEFEDIKSFVKHVLLTLDNMPGGKNDSVWRSLEIAKR